MGGRDRIRQRGLGSGGGAGGRGKRLLRWLAAPRLTLALMFALAVAAAAGTLLPRGMTPELWQQRFGTAAPWWQSLGLDAFFRSGWFRALWGALLVNLLACGLRRSLLGVRDVLGRGRPKLRLPGVLAAPVVRVLTELGFRISGGESLRASRRRYGFFGFPLVHLCPVLIVGGALWGSWGGFVGTTYGFLRQPTWSFFNWSSGQDEDLPFVIVVEQIRQLRHPLRLQVGLGEKDKGGRLVEAREGERFSAAPYPFEVEISTFDVAAKDLKFYLWNDRGRGGPYSSTAGDAPLRVVPVAYKDPQLKQLQADLTLLDGAGAALGRHRLAVNRPLVRDGVRVYLTAWSPDLEGEPWVGLQIVKDPGQWLVWSGAVGLTFGILLLTFVRGGWAREEEGEILVSADRAVLQRLRGLMVEDGDR